MTSPPDRSGMPRRRTVALLVLLAVGAPGTRAALACSTCNLGDTTLTAIGVDKPYRNRVRLGLEGRFGGHTQGSGDEALRSYALRSTLSLAWSPTARLTLNAALPVVSSWLGQGSASLVSYTGLGDLEFLVRGVIIRDHHFPTRHQATLLGGIKAPTGPRLFDREGYPYPEDEQPGSGSWDPIVGLGYGWYGHPVSLYVSGSYRHNLPGRRGYRRGPSVGATAALQYQPRTWFGVSLGTELRYTRPDQIQGGALVADTGGMVLALTPALLFLPRSSWLIRLGAQIPTYERYRGIQREQTTVLLSMIVDLR